MADKILSIDRKYEAVISSHERVLEKLQPIIDTLKESGIIATIDTISDLVNNGNDLYLQAETIARKEANGLFKLPNARRKFIDENITALNEVIDQAKKDFTDVLSLKGSYPLEINAYIIEKNKIAVSQTWKDEIQEQHTTRSTEDREEAKRRIEAVKVAIADLNNYVKENPYISIGITSSEDDRRCLCYLNDYGTLIECPEVLEYI